MHCKSAGPHLPCGFKALGFPVTSSVQLAVIADDLTGALDAVVAFANAGLRCVVATSPAHLHAALDQRPEVIAVSTNSRAMPAAGAALVTASVGRTLAGVPAVFKKIDSRLKGNIAAEVAALSQVLGLEHVLICPAIPSIGRTVQDGRLRGFGVAEPLAVAHVLADLPGLTVAAPDAETDRDIDRMLASLPNGTLLAGASGLSAGLARRMWRHAPRPVALPLPQPIVFVIGSRDPITLAQVAHLRRGIPAAAYLAAPNGLASGIPTTSGVLVLHATPGTTEADPAEVTRTLAASFLRARLTPASLVLTGGDTAAAVLAELDVGVLEVLGEALPGLPICRAAGHEASTLIVTKSGGFGAVETLGLLAGVESLSDLD